MSLQSKQSLWPCLDWCVQVFLARKQTALAQGLLSPWAPQQCIKVWSLQNKNFSFKNLAHKILAHKILAEIVKNLPSTVFAALVLSTRHWPSGTGTGGHTWFPWTAQLAGGWVGPTVNNKIICRNLPHRGFTTQVKIICRNLPHRGFTTQVKIIDQSLTLT